MCPHLETVKIYSYQLRLPFFYQNGLFYLLTYLVEYHKGEARQNPLIPKVEEGSSMGPVLAMNRTIYEKTRDPLARRELIGLEQFPPLGLRPLFEDFVPPDWPPKAVMIEGRTENENIYQRSTEE